MRIVNTKAMMDKKYQHATHRCEYSKGKKTNLNATHKVGLSLTRLLSPLSCYKIYNNS